MDPEEAEQQVRRWALFQAIHDRDATAAIRILQADPALLKVLTKSPRAARRMAWCCIRKDCVSIAAKGKIERGLAGLSRRWCCHPASTFVPLAGGGNDPF
jgi:hypothetical protein